MAFNGGSGGGLSNFPQACAVTQSLHRQNRQCEAVEYAINYLDYNVVISENGDMRIPKLISEMFGQTDEQTWWILWDYFRYEYHISHVEHGRIYFFLDKRKRNV